MTTKLTETEAYAQGRNADADAIPTAETLTAVWELPVRDRTGKRVPFRDVVAGPNAAPRVLVIFIRHWFCPACQGYVRRLATKATPEVLSSLPIKASIAIIGSGSPELIDHWVKESACPYPVYTDSSIKLYKAFKFLPDKGQGNDSEYHDLSPLQGFLKSASQIIRMPHRLHQGGHPFQNGGELLFEPTSSGGIGNKHITWCHRMQHATDHAKFADVFNKLGIKDDQSAVGAA